MNETTTKDFVEIKRLLNAAESSHRCSFDADVAKAVKLLSSIVWHEIDKKPATRVQQLDPCGRMARWIIHSALPRKPIPCCPEHMHILADAWEANIDKIILIRMGDRLCDYIG